MYFPSRIHNTQHYLEENLIRALTDCGAAYIDVPQTESILAYELDLEDKQQLEQTIDLFQISLFLNRETWGRKAQVRTYGIDDLKTYYSLSFAALLLLLWGIGLGGIWTGDSFRSSLLQEQRGIPLWWQQCCRLLCCMLAYVPALILIMCVFGAPFIVLTVGMLCVLELSLIFVLCGNPGIGIFLAIIWNLAGLICSGGLVPSVFLPEKLVTAAAYTTPGLCLQLLQCIGGGNITEGLIGDDSLLIVMTMSRMILFAVLLLGIPRLRKIKC